MAQKYTQEQMIAAIESGKGMIFVAAKRIGCSPQTIYVYAKKFPAVQQAIEDQRGMLLDTAELALHKAIIGGEAWAVCFALKTIGKTRGYIERQEITGGGGAPLFPTVYLPEVTDAGDGTDG